MTEMVVFIVNGTLRLVSKVPAICLTNWNLEEELERYAQLSEITFESKYHKDDLVSPGID